MATESPSLSIDDELLETHRKAIKIIPNIQEILPEDTDIRKIFLLQLAVHISTSKIAKSVNLQVDKAKREILRRNPTKAKEIQTLVDDLGRLAQQYYPVHQNPLEVEELKRRWGRSLIRFFSDQGINDAPFSLQAPA